MAVFRLGPIVVDARGSVGGLTISRNAGGSYGRKRVKPTNPQTPNQSLVRGILGANASAWGNTLVEAERSAWIAVAPNHPVPNKVGDIINLSGIQMFGRLNNILTLIGSAPITVPPADFSVTPLSSVILTATSGGSPALTITVDPTTLGADELLYISATPQGPASRRFAKNILRFIGTHADSASPISILTEWNTRFGSPALVAGLRISVSVAVVNSVTGVLSVPVVVTTVIA